jgi:6-phosphogluconate dehydrogenase
MSFNIGIPGPGVMGHDPALDMERNGFPAAGRDLEGACTQASLENPAMYFALRVS